MKEKNSALNKLLAEKNKGAVPEEPGTASEQPPKRSITLADGSVIDLTGNELTSADRANKDYPFRIEGKGYRQHYARPKDRELQLPVIKEWYEPPEAIKNWQESLKGLSEKQIRYRNDVVDEETLNRPAPKKQKSNNPQGWDRYIFWTDFVASKNGFIYYTLPLIASIIIFIIKLSFHDFWVNALFSALVLADIFALRAVFKMKAKAIEKTLMLAVLIGANVGIAYLSSYYTTWLEGLELSFALQMLLIFFSIYHFGKFYVYFAMGYAQDVKLDVGNAVQINAGKPGCGKTSSGVHDVVILAKKMWEKLQYDYRIAISREDKILAGNNNFEKLKLHEIKISYNFYITRPCIPCLWSIIGVSDKDGRPAHQLTLEHIKGIERLPLYSVLLLDEIGAILKADDGLNRKGIEKPLDVSDMFRLGRHFLKWTVIGCEQDFNHIYIDCRRVVGFNKVIQGQEWTCKPLLLYGIFNFLKFLFVDGCDKEMKKAPFASAILSRLERFIKGVGFRKIRFGYASNTQTNAGLTATDEDSKVIKLDGEKTRIIPSSLAGDYDDRAYREKYPSYFDKEIRGELHKYLHIEGVNEKTNQFVNVTDALLEKREAQREKIKRIA